MISNATSNNTVDNNLKSDIAITTSKKSVVTPETTDKKTTDKKYDLNYIVKLIQETGVVGENNTIKAIVIIISGKLVKNKSSFSTNIHLDDESSSGKDWIMNIISNVFFVGDWIKFNSPTPKAISLSQRMIKNKDDVYVTVGKQINSNRIVYIEDASEKFLNDDDFKMLTGEAHVKTAKVIQMIATNIEWDKPVVIITTAGTVTDNQIVRRLPSMGLDSTKEQTDNIVAKQNKNECNINDITYTTQDISELTTHLKTLEVVKVDLNNVINKIENRSPNSNRIIVRTTNARLLDYIKFATALHQKDRKRHPKNNNIIYANEDDVDMGFNVFEHIYGNEFVSVLNKRQNKILAYLKKHPNVEYKESEINGMPFSDEVSDMTTNRDMKRIHTQHPAKIMHNTDIYPYTWKWFDFINHNKVSQNTLTDKEC